MNKKALRERLTEILTPPAPRDASYHGGVVSWDYYYNKVGLEYLVNEIEELFDEFTKGEGRTLEKEVK